jgi:hypothetical protein
MIKIQRVDLTVKMLDVDFQSETPESIMSKIGLHKIELSAVANMEFVEKLIEFIKNELP